MFLAATIGLFIVLFGLGLVASRQSKTVDDFVLAGQRLGIFTSTATLVATWYGAESLLTLSDEVARTGLSAIWIDPVGIALCLWTFGLFLVPLLYRRQVSTVGDLFLRAGGPKAELIASLIIVPSYFGWIAAQLLAMGTMLHVFVGGSTMMWIFITPGLAVLLCVFGGNASIAWINSLLLMIVIIGLTGLVYAVIDSQIVFLREGGTNPMIPAKNWSLFDREKSSPGMILLGALAVGCVGNFPAIELLQRVRSAKDESTARWACLYAGLIYFALGIVPILCGLAFLGHGWTMGNSTQVISGLAQHHLSIPLQLLLFLAILATILSTLTSAAAAPASMLGLNLVEPVWRKFACQSISERTRMIIQRCCLAVMFGSGALLAIGGETAFQLVRDSYGMLLAAIVVPFLAILIQDQRASKTGIYTTMIVGSAGWAIHWRNGYDHLAGPWLEPWLAIPHELGVCLLCAVMYLLFDRAKL